MSKKRIALRIVLVLMLVGVLWIGYRGYTTGGPDALQAQAEASLAAGDHQTAKVYLQKLLRAAPESGAAHAMMAQVYLKEQAAAGQPATYAEQPGALAHLEEAARLEPDNTAVQEQLLAAYLDAGQAAKAAQVADAAKLETADALYAVLLRSVEQRDLRKVEESFYAFADLPSDKAFQGMALIAKAYRDANREEDLQKILDRTARLAGMLDETQLALITEQDRTVMLQELLAAVEQAPLLGSALTRMESLTHACERLAASELETPEKLGEAVCGAMIQLNSKFPQPGGVTEQAARKKLQERIRQFSAASLAGGQATPVMVYQSAVAAFEQGDVETGLQAIREGLAGVAQDDPTAVAQGQALQLLAARQLVMRGRFEEAKPYLEQQVPFITTFLS